MPNTLAGSIPGSLRVPVLIVDDRLENLTAIEGVLGDEPLELVRATSGNDALRQALRQDFALVLLDVQMPGMDGFETAELMRANPKTVHLPIIFVTAGMRDAALQFKGYDLGAVDYLIKPFAPHVLRSKVRVFCELYRQRRQLEAHQRLLESRIHERVAELRESEERFRLLATHAPVGIYQIDLESGAMLWSNQMYAIFGVSPGTFEPTPEAFRARLHPDDRDATDVAIREALASGSGFSLEYRVIMPGGKTNVVLTQGELIPGSDGRPPRLIGTALDISERKRAEKDLHAAKAEAERANNAKSRFLAAASHDLRQPLSALNLYIDVLQRKAEPSLQQLVSSMKDCAGSLSELLTDLLDLSKLDAGVVTPNVCDFPIAEIMSNLVSVHLPEAQIKGLRLHWRGSRLVARTDVVLYRRMLGNLLSNALRYTERGGVLISVRRRQGKAWIEVWDTGVGFPQEKAQEIFEEFKQLGDDSRSRGSGLGLAIVAKSAALLGLQIRVRSRPGRGSMFALELPLGQVASRLEPVQSAHRSLRIALVEDNASVRQALVHALSDIGHELLAAASGRELLAKLASRPLDLIISDYRLADEETGFEVISSVRAAYGENLPAIIITGDTDPRLLRSMAARGIVVQHKPLDIEALQVCISSLAPATQKVPAEPTLA